MDGESVSERFQKLPPHDLSAEKAMLASLIVGDPAGRATIRGIVGRADLYLADHQVIFDVICRMIDEGESIDVITLRARLEKLDLLAEVGGTPYLAEVLNSVPSTSHGNYYAEIVREQSVRRQIIQLADEMRRNAHLPGVSSNGDEIAQDALAALTRITRSGGKASFWKLDELLMQVVELMEKGGVPLMKTGLGPLDELTGGIGLGEMMILAARPSMGKSTALRQIIIRSAQMGIPTGIISLEEGGIKIGRNILAAECGIENNKIRKGELHKEDWHELTEGVGRLSGLPVYGTDKARQIKDIRNIATVWAARYGVKLIVLDYLQRVRGTGGENEYTRVSKVSGELSDLWKEIGVAAVVAAQLNRGVETRPDKRPNMADLRDSGQIEQDADGIVFLHREDYYHLDESDYRKTGVAEFIIAKWRDGVRGKVARMHSDLRYQCFRDYAPDPFAN